MNKEVENSVEIECCISLKKENLFEFLTSKSIEIKDIILKEIISDKSVYIVLFVSKPDSLIILEKFKTDDSMITNKFKIVKFNFDRIYLALITELIEKERTFNDIIYPIQYENYVLKNYMKSIGYEGLEYIDSATINKQRSVITYMIKKIGTNLICGKSVMNVSLPIYIFDYRSLLDSFAYDYKLAHHYLDKAGTCSELERMKLITCFFTSIFHMSLGGLKPFNPILGETFQCKIGESKLYYEQTSHHPPISTFYIINPNYKIYGDICVEASTGANSLEAVVKGKRIIEFNDGSKYSIKFPKFIMNGTLFGNRYVNYSENLVVEGNKLIAVVRFNPDERSYFKKLIWSKQFFPDRVVGYITDRNKIDYNSKKETYSVKNEKDVLSVIEGEWADHLYIDNKLYWKHSDYSVLPTEKQEFTLPSDSLFREDLILFKNGYQEYAQEAKVYLEEIQRNDRKLREAGKKISK